MATLQLHLFNGLYLDLRVVAFVKRATARGRGLAVVAVVGALIGAPRDC
jgi:hypothetical protein